MLTTLFFALEIKFVLKITDSLYKTNRKALTVLCSALKKWEEITEQSTVKASLFVNLCLFCFVFFVFFFVNFVLFCFFSVSVFFFRLRGTSISIQGCFFSFFFCTF